MAAGDCTLHPDAEGPAVEECGEDKHDVVRGSGAKNLNQETWVPDAVECACDVTLLPPPPNGLLSFNIYPYRAGIPNLFLIKDHFCIPHSW